MSTIFDLGKEILKSESNRKSIYKKDLFKGVRLRVYR